MNADRDSSLLLGALTERIIGCFYVVYTEVGLLLNFGPKPEFRRLVYDNERKAFRS